MTLLELAERCERAAGADRELDAQIIVALEHPEYRYPNEVLNRRPSSWREAADRLRHDGMGGSYPYPAYTASLDAAMTLVPEGLFPLLDWHGPHCRMRDERKCDIRDAVGFAATPTLALCAAALRARDNQSR